MWVDHANDGRVVHLLVLLPAFDFTDELFDHTEEHDKDGGNEYGERIIHTDRLEEVQYSCQEVEDVDQLLELEPKGDWEEGQPGVPCRFALICRSLFLLLRDEIRVELRRDFESVQFICPTTLP